VSLQKCVRGALVGKNISAENLSVSSSVEEPYRVLCMLWETSQTGPEDFSRKAKFWKAAVLERGWIARCFISEKCGISCTLR